MTRKHGGFVGKIISVLLLGTFLSYGFVSEHALCEEKKLLPQPDYDQQVAAMKDAFTDLYWKLWNQHDMTTRLRVHVIKAVDEYDGVAAWANEKDSARTQEKINQLFAKDFNVFFDDLKEQFQISFAKYALMYYRDLFEEVLEKIDDPAIKAKIKEACEEIINDGDVVRKKELSEETSGGIMSWLIRGVMTGTEITAGIVVNKVAAIAVNNIMKQIGITTMTGTLGAVFANPVLVAYGAYQVVDLENGPENMRNRLYDSMLRNYLYVVPDNFWSTTEGPVREVFKNIYYDTMHTVTEVDGSFEVDSDLENMIMEYAQGKN